MEVDFPRGPWERIFNGEWSGTKVHLFKNEDRYTLTAVEDREEGELKGYVFFLNKYYLFKGNISKINTDLGGYSLVFEKDFPTKKGRFFSISTGPKYAKTDVNKIDQVVEELFYKVKDKEKKLYELSKAHEIDLTELKNASEEEEEILFNRPVLIPALLMKKSTESEEPISKGQKVLIGKKLNETKAEENINTFKSSIIVGDEDQREKAMHVLLENCVLSGVNGIIFDESGKYDNLSSPNIEFPHQKYPDIQPIGMPVKNLKPGEIQINLNYLDKKSMREIMHIKDRGEEYEGKKSAEIIDDIIEGEKELKSLKDIEEEVISIDEEVDKFHRYRAVRWMKVMSQMYPDFLDGDTDLKSIVSAYLQSMGTIIRIDISSVPTSMKKAFVYSFLKTLYEENKKEGFQKRLRAIVAIPQGSTYTPSEPEERLQEKILEVLTDANAYGIGYALGTPHEMDIYDALIDDADLMQKFTGENEVALKPSDQKPYRAHLRPYLTS